MLIQWRWCTITNGSVAPCKYDKLMDAFRGVAYNVTTTDELRRALTTGIQSRKPTIINVIIDPAAGTESGHITKLNPKQVAGN